MGTREMKFILSINGKLDGSLMAAVKSASGALKQLRQSEQNAMNRPLGVLQNRLTELQQMQRALQAYAKAQSEIAQGKVGRGQFNALQEALRQLKAANVDTSQDRKRHV